MQSPPELLFEEFRRLSPKVTGGLMRMRQATYQEGVIPAKYKILSALVASVTIRCEPCIQAYVKMAQDQGATQEELIEFLNVVITMQGCPGEEWALKAYAFFKEVTSGQAKGQQDETCCQIQ